MGCTAELQFGCPYIVAPNAVRQPRQIGDSRFRAELEFGATGTAERCSAAKAKGRFTFPAEQR
ncbi:MAG: hypothetical protein ACKV1O_01975, partial [Saprospiraceae bacterium]